MGNETSQLTGLKIDEKAVEVTDFYSHHSAILENSDNVTELSVFIGEPLVSGSLWVNQTPLEKAAKTLMLYRHPCILKYISSWNKGSKFFLAVENIKPLSHILGQQTTQQICIGLYSVLKAIVFLNDNASASHNNVCTASVYVTPDGSWKLGGLEYLCRFQDLSSAYLTKTRTHRYEKAIDCNEDKLVQDKEGLLENGAIDQYAFGVLACEVLRKRTDDEISSLTNFRDFCKNELQNSDVKKRPKLSTILNHPFFTHDFIKIHSFLNELPLKSEIEKTEFFSQLLEKLRRFSETIIAEQLGGLLLSRMVLLDRTAQKEVLPYVFCPKKENIDELSPYLFSVNTFKQYIVPKLLQIFRVRDAQIRLLLLSHFKYFVHCFDMEQLQSCILPELLLGIKDTNDNLVATTLRSLADLVPILGASTVIGGKRAKIFTDGRPIIHQTRRTPRRNPKRHSDLRVPSLPVLREIPSEEIDPPLAVSPIIDVPDTLVDLPERPSPDGGEDHVSTTEDIDQSVNEDDLENWSDWEIQEMAENTTEQNLTVDNYDVENVPVMRSPTCDSNLEMTVADDLVDSINEEDRNLTELFNTEMFNPSTLDLTRMAVVSSEFRNKKNSLPDILELDIKNQKSVIQMNKNDEVDFFQDMEPVIDCSNKFYISNNEGKKGSKSALSPTFNVNEEIANREDGWGEELEWEEENQ